jgi:hypothetical protein
MLSRFVLSSGLALCFPVMALGADRPVVVELFTSEGCSSCPPADAFLSELSRRRDILPLAFHVTYWNDLGWRDPYSLELATERQAEYGTRFGDGSYTPEMVVDGRKDFVGSDRGKAAVVIGWAEHSDLTAARVSLSRKGSEISVVVGPGSGHAKVVLIGFDPWHKTAIGRGENGGRALTETNIVRSFRSIGEWNGAPVTFHLQGAAGERAAVILEAPDGTIIGAGRSGGPS